MKKCVSSEILPLTSLKRKSLSYSPRIPNESFTKTVKNSTESVGSFTEKVNDNCLFKAHTGEQWEKISNKPSELIEWWKEEKILQVKVKTQDGQNVSYGILKIDDYSTYVGWLKNGKPHGKGQLIFLKVGDKYDPTVSKYIGRWKEGDSYGKGIVIKKDGTKYDGESFNSDKTYGVYIWPNGAKYEGEWENNMRHGQGELRTSAGGI
jgi:hypothetical protein